MLRCGTCVQRSKVYRPPGAEAAGEVSMEIVEAVADLRAAVAAHRRQGLRIGFVPTLGNLHEGHLSLIDLARERGAGAVVVSIFVNPLQFGPAEDFATYPRTFEEDVAALEGRHVELLFAPTIEVMYPGDQSSATLVEVPGLSTILCGHFRPVHFGGVTTVVSRLFNMVQPDLAVFGEKDYQQLIIIKKMTADLAFPIEIVPAPTVREPDGLAMSSRNRYLSAAERRLAPELQRTLRAAAGAVAAGTRPRFAIEADARTRLERAGFQVDYVAVRDAKTLAEPAADGRQQIVLAAAWLGATRLIDNAEVIGAA
jgi:pantoate--beta-alanine ligase